MQIIQVVGAQPFQGLVDLAPGIISRSRPRLGGDDGLLTRALQPLANLDLGVMIASGHVKVAYPQLESTARALTAAKSVDVAAFEEILKGLGNQPGSSSVNSVVPMSRA